MPLRNNTEITAKITDDMNTSIATAARVADWIRLAEKRILRSLSGNGLLDAINVSKTLSVSTATKSIPAGIRGLPKVVYIDKSPKKVLTYFAPDEFFSRWAASTTGEPAAYTITGKTMHFGPSPDATYSVVAWYRQDINIARDFDQILIPEQDETDAASLTGGSGHAAGDVITMDDGSEVRVDTVSAGAVTEYTLTAASSALVASGDTISQSSTSGSGTGFDFTTDADSITNVILSDYPELYLFGGMIEGYLFTGNPKAQQYQAQFAEAIENIEDEQFMAGGGLQVFVREASAGSPMRRY